MTHAKYSYKAVVAVVGATWPLRWVHECAQCGYQFSVTAGTIFHKTRVRLLDWFWAIYRMS